MGILRVIFALAVVFAHSWPGGIMFVGGQNAVRLFYMISGFLISYILADRKPYRRLRDFYLNRYLRLYPTYIVIGLVAFTLRAPALLEFYRQMPAGANILLALSNIFIFGQDWVMFTGIRHGVTNFPVNFANSDVPLYAGLWVPQAWTLGVELTFYAMAPFILVRRKLIWLLLLASLAVRLFLFHMGLGAQDPWSYRFFPAELSLFLIGSLAHQVGLPFYRSLPANRLRSLADLATWSFILASLCYFLIPGSETWKAPMLLLVFAALLPLTFIFQNHYAADRIAGQLSYPIYICHMLVIAVVDHMTKGLMLDEKTVALICAAAAIAAGWVLNLIIEKPVGRLRDAIRGHGKNAA
jgi:peptidoglycan/LPS O-acetylase OafA/YrhL